MKTSLAEIEVNESMSGQNDKTPTPSERPGQKSGGEEHGYGPTPAGPKTPAPAKVK